MEKPRDDDHAFSMLSSLSGRRHLVHSGVSVFTGKIGKMEAAVSFCETTEVLFAALSPEEIRAYIRWVPYTQRPSAQILEDTGRDSAKSVARHAVPTLNLDPQTVVERVAVADDAPTPIRVLLQCSRKTAKFSDAKRKRSSANILVYAHGRQEKVVDHRKEII